MEICFLMRCNSRFCNVWHGSNAALVKNLEGLLDWGTLDARFYFVYSTIMLA